MKYTYLIGLLLVVLMVGCSAPEEAPADDTTAPATDDTTAPAADAAPEADAADITGPSDQIIPEENVDLEDSDLNDLQKEQIERMTASCKAGNAGLCAALKTQYGIEVDMNPGEDTGIEEIEEQEA
jgi:hypothetical protein